MPQLLGDALRDAAMITAFVGMMMIAVEYLNVLTRGTIEHSLQRAPALQYGVAALLGATPGCLGAFTVVALFSHRVVTIGAVVACMVATFGDEAFVLLALAPRTAVLMMLGLVVLGVLAAPLADRAAGTRRYATGSCAHLPLHLEDSRCFVAREVIAQWRRPRPHRLLLSSVTLALLAWVISGGPGVPPSWNWVRITFTLLAAFGTFIVATVPDHFLHEHLWRHVATRHVPRIFAWTAGALIAITLLDQAIGLQGIAAFNRWALLAAALLIGLIPESGPHLVFVTLYAAGSLPLGVLVASSIVQDGHGMLPLLAHSRSDFLKVKAFNLALGLLVGVLMLAAEL